MTQRFALCRRDIDPACQPGIDPRVKAKHLHPLASNVLYKGLKLRWSRG